MNSHYRIKRDRLLSEFRKKYFTDLLIKYKGNVTHAARAAGIDGANVRKFIKTLNIPIKEIREHMTPEV